MTRLPLLAATFALSLAGCATMPPPAEGFSRTEWIRYACPDGTVVDARYPNTDTAQISRGGQVTTLTIQRSASGARYTGGGWEWWTKGREGTLSPLRSGEDIASSPGMTCTAPA